MILLAEHIPTVRRNVYLYSFYIHYFFLKFKKKPKGLILYYKYQSYFYLFIKCLADSNRFKFIRN